MDSKDNNTHHEQQTSTHSNSHEHERQPSGQARSSSTSPKRKRRRLKKSIRRTVVMLVAVVVLLGSAWVITEAIQRSGEDRLDLGTGSSIPPSSASDPGQSQPDASGNDIPVTDVNAWNFVGPVEQLSDSVDLAAPDRRMIALPENGRIDMQYFETAVFVGDSLTQGLQMWGGITNANYCAYKGVSPQAIYNGQMVTRSDGEKEVPIDAIVAYQPDNVYVLLGTNMVGTPNETLLAYYSEMLDVMRERLGPEVNIYVQSITPVVQGVDARFSAENTAYLNDELAKMAWEKGMYFLDLHEVLTGDDGWMKPEYGAADGYHMQPAGYKAWVEYLVTHTAYDPRHAHLYLEDSAYETPTE